MKNQFGSVFIAVFQAKTRARRKSLILNIFIILKIKTKIDRHFQFAPKEVSCQGASMLIISIRLYKGRHDLLPKNRENKHFCVCQITLTGYKLRNFENFEKSF